MVDYGYTRIRGALAVLSHRLGRWTIARILADRGLDPTPERPTKWSSFLRAQLGHVFATDFFDVEVMTIAALVRYRHRSAQGANRWSRPRPRWRVDDCRGERSWLDPAS